MLHAMTGVSRAVFHRRLSQYSGAYSRFAASFFQADVAAATGEGFRLTDGQLRHLRGWDPVAV